MGAITPEERAAVIARSPVGARYDTPVNRESAYEILGRRTSEKAEESRPPEAEAEKAAAILREEMEGCVQYAVPLSTDVHIGKNWLEAH